MADNALVSITLNIGLNTIAWVAEGSITVDAVVTGLAAV